jgi:hypothetical protein
MFQVNFTFRIFFAERRRRGVADTDRMLQVERYNQCRRVIGGRGKVHHCRQTRQINSPLDQHILNFAGIDPKKLLAELKKGKGDRAC